LQKVIIKNIFYFITFFIFLFSTPLLAENNLIDFRLAHKVKQINTVHFKDNNGFDTFVEKTSIITLADIETVNVKVEKSKLPFYLELAAKMKGLKSTDKTVSLKIIFNENGTVKLANVTSQNIGKRLAIFVKNEFIIAPEIIEEIKLGKALIATHWNEEDTKKIQNLLDKDRN